MAHAATVVMEMSGDVARGVAGALEVEAAAGLPRVAAVVGRQGGDGCGCRSGGDGVTIGLTADDASSLRAALNSFLRWADLAASVSQGASDPARAPAKPGERSTKRSTKKSSGRRRAAPRRAPRKSASARPRSRSSPLRGTRRNR